MWVRKIRCQHQQSATARPEKKIQLVVQATFLQEHKGQFSEIKTSTRARRHKPKKGWKKHSYLVLRQELATRHGVIMPRRRENLEYVVFTLLVHCFQLIFHGGSNILQCLVTQYWQSAQKEYIYPCQDDVCVNKSSRN